MSKGKVCFDMGNIAIAEGAIAAGARYFAGYPITPSTEIAEHIAARMPEVNGTYIQMEDEIGSIAAIIGASSAGMKSFTATSGPGMTLMQENLSAAVVYELPIVVVDVQRSGPSTGLATKASQGDVMAVKWGGSGAYEIIVLAPSSVQECYDFTIAAFNLSERYRVPAILLADKWIGHLRERFVAWEPTQEQIINRRKPTCLPGEYMPFDFERYPDGVAALAPFGDPHYQTRLNSSGHNEKGVPCGTYTNTRKFIHHYVDKLQNNIDDITITKKYGMADAEYVLVSFGCSVRSALRAMEIGREQGIKIGVLQLVTVWPFPDNLMADICQKSKAVFVPELNLGMIIREIQRVNSFGTPVIGINRIDTELIEPKQILDAIKEAMK